MISHSSIKNYPHNRCGGPSWTSHQFITNKLSRSSHAELLNIKSIKSLKPLIITLVLISILASLLSTTNCLNDENPDRPHNIRAGCPNHNWFLIGSKCHKIFFNARNHEQAKARCQELSGQLALVEDDSLREDETTIGQPQQPNSNNNNSSLISYFSSHETNLKSRSYYVNISTDLLRQYRVRAQSENTSLANGGGDSFEHMDSDYLSPSSNLDLWIPREDVNYRNFAFNTSKDPPNTNPGFILSLSNSTGRWGLMPVSPSRKAAFVCERPIVNSEAHQQQSSYPPRTAPSEQQAHNNNNHHSHSHHHHNHHQGQNLESRRAGLDSMNQAATGVIPDHLAPPNSGGGGVGGQVSSDPRSFTTAQPDVLASALFRDFPQNQSIVLGSTSEMRCSALESDSIITWTFNGKNLTQSNRLRQYTNGTLRIEHVRNSDGGNYACTIHSGGIQESRIARLEIIERPHQPEYIQAELLDKLSTSVRIRWTPGFNGNTPITKYLVEMRTINNEKLDSDMNDIMQSNLWEIAKANISADQTSVIIPDLKPAKRYIFRIKAANRVGTGDPSLPTRNPIEVPVQPPSMAPENLSGSPRSSTSISVQWSPPPIDSQNGIIKGYNIRHKLAGYASDAVWYTNEVSEATHLNFVLDDLIAWQNYEIQIAAENDKGIGPYSQSIFVRTKEGRPDKGPRGVLAEAVSSSMIKVNWNPPPPQHINGQNQGYRVQVWGDESHTQLVKEAVVLHNSLTPLQTTTIDSLQPYTDYYVTVKCFTSAGDGMPNEEIIVVRTKQDLPEQVPVLEFADVLDKTMRLVWKPPLRINGELSHYTLEYSETSASEKKISKKFPPTVTEARIVDLIPKTSYTFRIYPHTDAGQGPVKINRTITSVPPVLPEPPSNLTLLHIGPYSVTIQFEPGFNGNAGIEKWVAEAQTPTSRWQTVYVSTNHSANGQTVVVRNLRPYTRYQIRLSPTNIVGSSRYPSEPTPEFNTSQVEPEQPPRDLTLEEIRSNSALARWSPLGNNLWLGSPRGYNLTWSESNNSTVMHQLINDTRADSFLVRDLEEYTEYMFRLYAVNEAGASPPSEQVSVMTLEDVPSHGPSNLTAHALSSTTVSVDWSVVPKRHRNGIIRGYKIQYQATKPDAPLQHRTIDDNSTKHVTLNDLKPFSVYHLAIAAYTFAGDGVYSPVISVRTLEDTPGAPQNLSSPTVSQTFARILWDPPEDPNGDIIGYKVSYRALTEGSKEVVSHELHQNERTFKATNLEPNVHYMFTVTAKTKEGWGQQANMMLDTYDPELRSNLPFHRELWFRLMCACAMIVTLIIAIALLFIQTKSYEYKQNAIKSTSQDRLGDAGFTLDDEAGNHYNNGFGLLSNLSNHRRSNGALSQSTANFTLPKTPPRPHPGSVVYSDDGDDDVFEETVVAPVAGTSRYDSSGDSLTEKPSERSSSTAPESESADDDMTVNKRFVNHYANVNGTSRGQPSWTDNGVTKRYSTNETRPKRPQRPAPSVPQVPSDHQTELLNKNQVNLNGGRIIIDNMAGSRAPLNPSIE